MTSPRDALVPALGRLARDCLRRDGKVWDADPDARRRIVCAAREAQSLLRQLLAREGIDVAAAWRRHVAGTAAKIRARGGHYDCAAPTGPADEAVALHLAYATQGTPAWTAVDVACDILVQLGGLWSGDLERDGMDLLGHLLALERRCQDAHP